MMLERRYTAPTIQSAGTSIALDKKVAPKHRNMKYEKCLRPSGDVSLNKSVKMQGAIVSAALALLSMVDSW